MELTLNIGDNINIPENCEVAVKDNTLTIKEKHEIFKDGDILVVKDNPSFVVIFERYSPNRNIFYSYYNNQKLSNINWSVKCFRHATKEEKQAFFDALKAQGLRWKAETKTMERIRKRVKKGEEFLYINSLGNVESTEDWGEGSCDDDSYNSGNYYLLEEREQAEKDAKEIKAIYQRRFKV